MALGQEGYNEWANKNKSEAIKIEAGFCPKEISGPGGRDLIPQWNMSRLTADELKLLRAMAEKMEIKDE